MTRPIPFTPTPAERLAELRAVDKDCLTTDEQLSGVSGQFAKEGQLYEQTVQFAEPPTLRRSLREGCIDALLAVGMVFALGVVVGVFA